MCIICALTGNKMFVLTTILNEVKADVLNNKLNILN